MEEENFPRGGVVKKHVDSSTKKKPIEKDLFQTGADDTKADKGKKRKKKDEKDKKTKKQKVTPSKSISYNTGQIQQLSTKIISTDMLILGCVKEIHEYEVILSLPNGLSGSVPLTNISDAYHEQLKLLASQGQTEELEDLDVHGLHEIFKIGTVLPCKVMSIGQNKKGKTSIKLSINPKHVNQAFEASTIRDGVVLFGNVASQEDHGYVIDLGVKSVRAFLKNKDAERYVQMYNDGYPLRVGQSVMCMVQTGKDKLAMLSGESRTVSVTIDPNKLSECELHDESEIPFRSLIPGMKITATVDKTTDEGITVKFLQYNGSIHRSHLSTNTNKVVKSKQIKVCILYIHPSTKAVAMTNLPHLVDYKGVPVQDMFGQLIGGQIVDNAEVMKKGQSSVLFKLPGDIKAFCGVNNLSDGKISNMETTFKHGTKHRCRIMDFSYIDGLVIISLKQSILNLKYMTIQEVQSGDIIECTVHSLFDKGVSVKLSPTIRGFIPNLHLANSTFKAIDTKQFAEGKQLKCRVLKVDEKKRNVILTHKKMLLNTKLPLLTNFDQLQHGLEVEGFIAKINNHGVLVAFYNEMRGWVPKKFLSTEDIEFPEKVFFVGQVVKSRVKSWNEEEKKIVLSFRIDPKFAFGTKQDSSDDGMKLGEIVNCEVIAKVETGLDVKLPSSKTAFLPTKHLTDSMETSHSLLNTYNTGDIIEKVMFLSKTNVPIMTLRKAMVEYGSDNTVVTSVDDLQVGMMIPGMVKNVMSYGVFIQLVGGLIGLSPNKFALDSKIEDLNEVYKQGQSVVAKVTEVDKEKNRFLISLRMQDCYHGDTNIGLDLLQSYLSEMDVILDKVKHFKGKKSKLGDIVIGQVYDFAIKDVSSDGILGHVTKDVMGIYNRTSTDDVAYTVGTTTECVVLSIDVEHKCVEVTLCKTVVKAVKNKKQKKINKVEPGMPVEGEVILIKKDCIVVLLKGQVSGNIAYLPSRRHLNDVMEVHQFSIGQTHPMIVKRIEDGHVLCSLEIHEKKTSSLMESRQKLQLGDIVSVSIKDIHQWQLNVTNREIHGRIHMTELTDCIENGTNPLSRYKQNQELKARVIGFREYHPKHQSLKQTKTQLLPEFSVRSSILETKSLQSDKHEKFKKGQEVIGYVINYDKNSLWLQVTPSVKGRIKLFNLSTDQKVLENPKKHFHSCQGYNATVLDVLNDGLLELTFIGDKPSMKTKKKSSPTSIQKSTTIQCGKIYKGVISDILKESGLVVQISDGGKGVVKLTEISDKYKDDPTSDFTKGQSIDCYVVSCDKPMKCDLSLRKSRISKCKVTDPAIENIGNLSEGQILRGYIVHRTKSQLLVSLGRDVTGSVTSQGISDYLVENVEAAFSVGKVVTAKIISISDKVISLSLRESVTGAKEIISEEFKTKKRKSPEKIKDKKNKKRKRNDSDNTNEKDGEGTKTQKKKDKKKSHKRKTSLSDNANVSIDSSKKLKLTSDSDSGIDDVDPDKVTSSKKHDEDLPRINVKLDWCWDSEYKSPVVSKAPESDSEDDESEESETDTVTTKEEIQKDKKEEEKKLYKFEQHQLQGDTSTEVAEDFDRLTLQSPDSSLVWLRYMAFHLETAEIEKARAVAERALKTISFREEQEKMNVWVAYLNLETMYGTPEELTKVLERALQQNDPLTVYQHLINIYSKSGKFQEAENTYNIMTRKFSYKKEPWIGYGLFHFKNGNFEAARKILPRCLKSLSKENHVETIAKFAQMEFKHGQPERGKTMFENILSNYPKRTDLWSVYIDMVIKTSDIEAARQLLTRVIHMKLSAKKMKFFFKKYLDFEKSHGDEKHIDFVKKKAFEYVESKGFEDE